VVRAFGKSNLTALTIAASLAQIGEFSFVLASLGLSLRILPQDASDLILAGALLSIMVGPVLFKILDRMHRRQDRHLDAHPSASQPADDYQIDPGIDAHAIIVGFGRVGSHLSTLLRERGVPLVVIEEDAESVERARKAGFPAVRGNVADERVMHEAAPERAKLVVFAIPHTLEAGEAIARLKLLSPELTVLARAHSDTEVKHLLAHGADATVLAERELAYSLAEMVMATPPYRPARAV
jgi:CPA2 family monovalent cation:H+ antiporter-2